MMKVRIWSMSLVITVVFAALVPASIGAQSLDTETSIMVTDVITGIPIVGDNFTTDLQISIANNVTPEIGIMGVEIWLSFDPSIVTVDDFDGNASNGTQVEIKNGFFDGDIVVGANEVIVGTMPPTAPAGCAAAGACVHVALSHTGGSGPVTNGTGAVATVTWSGLATGPSAITILTVPPGILPGSVLSDPDGNPIPIDNTSVPVITVANPGVIEGIVRRQGTQTDHAGTEIVAISVHDSAAATATAAADGSFSLVAPLGSTYIINARYPGYLQSQNGSVYVMGTGVNIGTTKLVGGDVNADNCINILDIVSIIAKFGRSALPASDSADINDDGTVNIFDLTISAGNFGRCGPTTWVP